MNSVRLIPVCDANIVDVIIEKNCRVTGNFEVVRVEVFCGRCHMGLLAILGTPPLVCPAPVVAPGKTQKCAQVVKSTMKRDYSV